VSITWFWLFATTFITVTASLAFHDLSLGRESPPPFPRRREPSPRRDWWVSGFIFVRSLPFLL
jgi:hypothetical protein